eukprot:COSAG02_NODE_19599_length_873_cov_135.091564_1_plen_25_part_01
MWVTATEFVGRETTGRHPKIVKSGG